MALQISFIFVLGCPGAGKSTLCALLTDELPVLHISVGDLLRRIKNDTTHPQAGAIASKLKKQELIDGNILIPILKSELEGLEPQELGRRVVLLDGFPRNLAQLRTFEETVAYPVLVLSFNCPKGIAKQRYLTRSLKGREADDETLFEKRYKEYVRENKDVVREYQDRGLLVELDTSKRTEESRENLYIRLEKDIKWISMFQS